jgi:hypothetical protein
LKDPSPEFLHQVMQLSGVVTVDPDGKTAHERWYGFGAVAIPLCDGVMRSLMCESKVLNILSKNGNSNLKSFGATMSIQQHKRQAG